MYRLFFLVFGGDYSFYFPVKQRGMNFFLQITYRLTQTLLRNIQVFGGFGEVLILAQLQKIF
jgi:hypothetical protein